MQFINYTILTCVLLPISNTTYAQHYFDTSIPNILVKENAFIKKHPNAARPPIFEEIKSRLPEPVWPKRNDVVKCYWKAWQIAFSNVHGVTKENQFIQPYIDAAFNNHIFIWDSTFMLLFGRYGRKAFNFQASLDNFYHKQHNDGYICREIAETNGNEIFEKFDPSSTGPNIIPWAEWEYYLSSDDHERLKQVFSPLMAYYQWFRIYRSWPDGSYYSSGWGCGMDNQPRVPPEYDQRFSHAFMSWIDTTLQQIFAGKILICMAEKINRLNDVKEVQEDVSQLTTYVNQHMWDMKTAFYYDRFHDGRLSNVKSIAAFWALLAETVPQKDMSSFIAHLQNPEEFDRLHRVPTLSADTKGYNQDGGYWCGGVWAPTSYMVLSGLTKYRQDSLAHAIAVNHLNNVVEVFNETGTLWENYAPDKVKGNDKKDMVGWTGLVPISVLFEYIFGIRPTIDNTIIWDIRMTDEFGVKKYPYKQQGLINFWCARRAKDTDEPQVKIRSNIAFTLKLAWNKGSKIIHVKAN
ncbi:MGH1-like glycoside hydrolase domain-containing protein [Pedobacter sp. AW31-3R]|uniref:MGH1-like glycoside hydrolase domain-containing protein n=1 Tax=Pedobacter sp. AW31-3R TaxID=3445781 RepID=UPI003FA12347